MLLGKHGNDQRRQRGRAGKDWQPAGSKAALDDCSHLRAVRAPQHVHCMSCNLAYATLASGGRGSAAPLECRRSTGTAPRCTGVRATWQLP